MSWPKGQGPTSTSAGAREGGYASLSSQQIRSIQQSPKGKLPPFISGGVYREPGLTSIGGSIGRPGSNIIGGTIGIDRGKPFGSVNVKGKVIGSFGSQGK